MKYLGNSILLKIVVVSILIIPFFNYCKKKEDKISISGTISDPYQNIVVNGVRVSLYLKKVESSSYSNNYTLIGTASTDNNGAFTFTTDPTYAVEYKLELNKDNYFSRTYIINPSNISSGTDYNKSYDIYSEAFLNLSINNIYPFDSTDYISCKITNNSDSCNSCCSNAVKYFIGEDIDTTINCLTYGGQELLIEWTVIKDGINKFYSSKVLCSSFDTTYFVIDY